MDNINISELAANAINALKGLNTEQLLTVGFVAYIFGMYKVKSDQLSDNHYRLCPDDVIDVTEASE